MRERNSPPRQFACAADLSLRVLVPSWLVFEPRGEMEDDENGGPSRREGRVGRHGYIVGPARWYCRRQELPLLSNCHLMGESFVRCFGNKNKSPHVVLCWIGRYRPVR